MNLNLSNSDFVPGEVQINKMKLKTGFLEVAIITRNRADFLHRLLFSLLNQTVFPKRVIVIDNNSSDRTKNVVQSFSKVLPVEYFKEEKVGIPFARNRALDEARSKLLAFIDDDCEAETNWVEEILKAHKKYPRVAAIQGRAVSVPKGSLVSILFETNYLFWLSSNIYEDKYINVCDTKNLSLKVGVLRRLKIRFDISFKRGSDMDFAKQLQDVRQRILYLDLIQVYHRERRDLVSFAKQIYQSGCAQVKIDFKWPGYQQIFKESDKQNYAKIIKNIGFGLPNYKKELIKHLFWLNNRLFGLGTKFQRFLILKDIIENRRLQFNIHKAVRADVTVAIVTKNRPNELKRCLLSMVNQTVGMKELLIIDSSKDDMTRKVLLSFNKYLPVKYIREKRSGISWARNKVLNLARGSIIACIDDDCEAMPNWLTEMLNAHVRNPKAVAIQGQCRVFPRKGVLSRVIQEDYNLWISRNLKDNNELLALDLENTSFKKSILDHLKVGYDDDYKQHYYCEDIDFGFKLLIKSQSIVFWPQAQVKVWRRSSILKLLKQRYLKGRSRAILDFKWALINNRDGLILRGIKIPYDKNASNIKRIIAMPFRQKISFYNPLLAPLPDVGMAGIQRLFFLYLYHKVYMLSYDFQRMIFINNIGRLNKTKNYSNQKDIKSKVLVLVVNDGDSSGLDSTLEALNRQQYKPDEIVVFNRSNVDLKLRPENYKKGVKVHYTIFPDNSGADTGGVAKWINREIDNVNSDIIAITESYSQIPSDWCLNIVKAHTEYPKAVVVQGYIRFSPEDSVISTVEQIRTDIDLLINLEQEENLTTMNISNLSFKVSELKKTQLKFRTDLAWYTERDLAIKLTNCRQQIIFDPNVMVCSYIGKGLIEYSQQYFQKGISSRILENMWKKSGKIKKDYLVFHKYLRPIYRCLVYPGIKKDPAFFLQVVAAYYFSEMFFFRGKKVVDKITGRTSHKRIISV